MNQITKTLAVAGLVLSILTSSCKKDLVDKPVAVQSNALARAKPVQPILQQPLVTGLEGGLGSTIGPGGDLFVPDSKAGAILRIDPKTGDYTTFASGLPQLIPILVGLVM